MDGKHITINQGSPDIAGDEEEIRNPSNMKKIKYDMEGFFEELQSPKYDDETAFITLLEYYRSHRRILYSVVTTTVYKCLDDEIDSNSNSPKFGTLRTNMESLVKYTLKDSNLMPHISAHGQQDVLKTCYTTWKIWDHLQLAERQYTAMRNPMNDYNQKMEGKFEKFQAKLTKETSGQLISLVGIFTAVAFILFGGIGLFDTIIKGLQNTSLPRLMVIGCMWGLEMLNVIFVFLFCIGKMTGQDFKSSKDEKATFYQKYPVVVLTNYILIIVMIAFMWGTFWVEHGLLFNENLNYAIAFGGGILIAGVFTVLGRWRLNRANLKKNSEDDEIGP